MRAYCSGVISIHAAYHLVLTRPRRAARAADRFRRGRACAPTSAERQTFGYCTTPSITFGAPLTAGFVPRYSLSELLLGSWVPPEGSVCATRVIEEQGDVALAPRFLSRNSALNALTIKGVEGFG